MGDPCGIGPEVTAKAWRALHATGPCFVVAGDWQLYPGVPVEVIETLDQAPHVFKTALPVLAGFEADNPIAGKPDAKFGPVILRSIQESVDLVVAGAALGLVTAPISKAIVQAAGLAHPGHTEFLGALLVDKPTSGPRGPIMMLAIEGLRVVPVTIHCALAQVPVVLSTDAIVQAACVTAHALIHDFEIKSPRLAIAALNPHAGEDGSFGDEEKRIIQPAIDQIRAMGIDAQGPYPADSLFHAQARVQYDAIICMYHDQALIPLKTLDFWGGVNVTLGLPIVRTSPDHGTGFDIAGKGVANPESMIAAIQMAHAMGSKRATQ
jgi:4-hydroxythreonine-4-phosphate dehydrogenase